ncbi:hypothetical protein DUNSADRAFT_13667 [Dunaliella salina]|uniref:Uncharacterized protein n=1 Tax=Dunaliella salina TaxID=3046 RepID=A0ABQ7G8X6_DUNSA|nr:hypothetical protein DUNSADRAFT_13667 [Dunaliella salina]|eukprot:KAF5831056.1 hypothetical protein DUNSADRAFT_13667 [Dunaliella salina]
MLALGGATMVVSTASMTITRLVVDKRKKQYLITCPECTGSKKLACEVCRGERILNYHPTKHAPFDQTTQCTCAMCEGSGLQQCLNCLGEGTSIPLSKN